MAGAGPAAEQDEEELVRLMTEYQAGRLEAFERLYLRLAPGLRGYFAAATRSSEAADDLVQETFMEVHRSRRLYLPPLPVRPWAFGVARNVLRRHRRATWRRSRQEESAATAVAPPGRFGGARPAVERTDLDDALRRLPAGRRDAFLLHHLHGFSFEQVAERLRIGAGAAKLRSSRAMRALRFALGIDRGDPDE